MYTVPKEPAGGEPFYSCLLSDLAFGWQRGWSYPDFDAFVM